MKVSPLIKGQEVGIDPHKKGVSVDWDDPSSDIHLHKQTNRKDTNKKKKDKYVIKIPLNLNDTNREITVERDNKTNQEIPQQIKKEVQEAFKDKTITAAFVKDVVEAVKNYNDKTKTQEQRARQAMGNIKKAFGLDIPRATIKGWIRKSLKLYSQFFEVKGTYYYVILTNDLFAIGEMTPVSFVEMLMKIESTKLAKWRFEILDENELD